MRCFILSICAVLLIASLCSCAGQIPAVSDGSSPTDAAVGMSDLAAVADGTDDEWVGVGRYAAGVEENYRDHSNAPISAISLTISFP